MRIRHICAFACLECKSDELINLLFRQFKTIHIYSVHPSIRFAIADIILR